MTKALRWWVWLGWKTYQSKWKATLWGWTKMMAYGKSGIGQMIFFTECVL
jgi:hypothetical protein